MKKAGAKDGVTLAAADRIRIVGRTAWFEWAWPASPLFEAALSLAIGLVYALLLLGTRVLDPTDLSWLHGDPALHYIGWALFSQTPGWHWPLTFTDRLGYPIGDAIANVDMNSVPALALKPFASLLPPLFQYFGLWAVLSIALQFYFGVRLLRLFFGRQFWPLFCGGLLFALSPAMTWRFRGHFSLANHWVILAGFCLYFAVQRDRFRSPRRLSIAWCSLTAVAIAINPYLGVCVLGISAAICLRSVLVWHARWQMILVAGALAGFSFLLSGYALGLIRRGGGFAGGGYRLYSMNLLAPIDSQIYGALLLKSQAQFPGQYEGYNYLGLGTLALILVLLGAMVADRWRPRWRFAEIVPLAVLGTAFFLLALSTKVTLGSQVLLDLDPHERLTPYLAPFRASGRLFWVPYYLITLGVVWALFRVFPKRPAAILGVAVLVLQFADGASLRASVSREVSPQQDLRYVLHSPVWSHLREKHQNLLVFPPWQCGPDHSPGGAQGEEIFGVLAVMQHLRISGYFSSRYSPQTLAWHCQESVQSLSGPLRNDSAYVLTPNLAALVAENNAEPNLCHALDGFILCSKVTDFGLGRGIKLDAPALPGEELSFGASTSSKYLVAGWWGIEPWGAWSNGEGILWFQVPPGLAQRFHNFVLDTQILVYKRPVTYSMTDGANEVRGVLSGGRALRVERLSLKLPLSASGKMNLVHVKVKDTLRAVDVGLNRDTRPLGAGVLSLRLAP